MILENERGIMLGECRRRRCMIGVDSFFLQDKKKLGSNYSGPRFPGNRERRTLKNSSQGSLDVSIKYPLLGFVWTRQAVDFLDGIMAASSRSETVATAFKPGFPAWFQGIFDHCLKTAINDNGYSEWSLLSVGFRYVDSLCRLGFPGGVSCEEIDEFSSGGWYFYHHSVHTRRVLSCTDLRYSSDTDESVRVTFQHEFLQRAHFFQIALLCCPEDPLSQITNSLLGLPPIDGIPISLSLGSVCREVFLHLTFPLIDNLYIGLSVKCQVYVSTLSGWVLPYPAGYVFPLPFGCWLSLLRPSHPHWRFRLSLRAAYWFAPDSIGVPTFRAIEMRLRRMPSLLRGLVSSRETHTLFPPDRAATFPISFPRYYRLC
jgi:hypothetical protein